MPLKMVTMVLLLPEIELNMKWGWREGKQLKVLERAMRKQIILISAVAKRHRARAFQIRR
jgi:hypothetical protein